MSGCSAARLARMLREHEAAGSNPATPTSKINGLQRLLTQKACGIMAYCVRMCQITLALNKKLMVFWFLKIGFGSSFFRITSILSCFFVGLNQTLNFILIHFKFNGLQEIQFGEPFYIYNRIWWKIYGFFVFNFCGIQLFICGEKVINDLNEIITLTLINLAPHNGVKFPSPIYERPVRRTTLAGGRVRDEGNILIISVL